MLKICQLIDTNKSGSKGLGSLGLPCPCQRDFDTAGQLCLEGGKIQFGGNGFTSKQKMLSLLAKLKKTSYARKDDCLACLQHGGRWLWSCNLTANQGLLRFIFCRVSVAQTLSTQWMCSKHSHQPNFIADWQT